jgi:hypothetical protein
MESKLGLVVKMLVGTREVVGMEDSFPEPPINPHLTSSQDQNVSTGDEEPSSNEDEDIQKNARKRY